MLRRSGGERLFSSKVSLTPGRSAHFFLSSSWDDDCLETSNQEFWRSLLRHIRSEVAPDSARVILDVGCNRGGLLELLARSFLPERLIGLEPLASARSQALFRLKGTAREILILDSSKWQSIPRDSVDLATVHEVLHLVADLPGLLASLARVLRPEGRAFIVMGCHTENPVWHHWKEKLTTLGHETFDRSPMEVLKEASGAGFHTSVRPLRRDGWVIYDPLTADFQYPSIGDMLDHQYRHKLLFRLRLRRAPQG